MTVSKKVSFTFLVVKCMGAKQRWGIAGPQIRRYGACSIVPVIIPEIEIYKVSA